MIAVSDGNTISIGRDFVNAVSDNPVWLVSASGQKFAVNYECTGDQACTAVKAVFLSHKKKAPVAYQFQRA